MLAGFAVVCEPRLGAGLWARGEDQRHHFVWVNKPRHADPCVCVLEGHSAAVIAIAASSDDSVIVSLGEDARGRRC